MKIRPKRKTYRRLTSVTVDLGIAHGVLWGRKRR